MILVLSDFLYDHEPDYEDSYSTYEIYAEEDAFLNDIHYKTGATASGMFAPSMFDLADFQFMHGLWGDFDRNIYGNQLVYEYLQTHVYSNTDLFPDSLKSKLLIYRNQTDYLRHSSLMSSCFGSYLTYSEYQRFHTVNEFDIFYTLQPDLNFFNYTDDKSLDFIALQRRRQFVYLINQKGFFTDTDVDYILFLRLLDANYS